MNFIKRLFDFKKDKRKLDYCGVEPLTIDKVLNEDQVEGVLTYYAKRKDFVDKIMGETNKAYEPSQIEDKINPSIWKPEYWNWFFDQMEK